MKESMIQSQHFGSVSLTSTSNSCLIPASQLVVIEERLTHSETARLKLQQMMSELQQEKTTLESNLTLWRERAMRFEHLLNQVDRSLIQDHTTEELVSSLAQTRVLLATERSKNDKLMHELRKYIGIYGKQQLSTPPTKSRIDPSL